MCPSRVMLTASEISLGRGVVVGDDEVLVYVAVDWLGAGVVCLL